MAARAGEAAAELLGCFPGAVVARGPDWRFGDQDGGPGARGVVREVRRFSEGVKYFLYYENILLGARLEPRCGGPGPAHRPGRGQRGVGQQVRCYLVRSYNIFKFAQ